jgi:hypothetical protein
MELNKELFLPVEPGFGNIPTCTDIDCFDADIAFVGVHYRSPYPDAKNVFRDSEDRVFVPCGKKDKNC